MRKRYYMDSSSWNEKAEERYSWRRQRSIPYDRTDYVYSFRKAVFEETKNSSDLVFSTAAPELYDADNDIINNEVRTDHIKQIINYPL